LGAISFEGKMIDRMSYMQAKELLSKRESMSIREKKESEVSTVNILDIFR
jgi:hypothetical protein